MPEIQSHTDEHYMLRCFDLARLGAGFVAPNPMVGAVLMHEGRIIGEGYHRVYGQAHAEVNCLDSVAEADRPLIPHATLYVSLEPCAHHGKTPPCVELILLHGIPKVVISVVDPFAAVNGKGISRLREAGVDIITGVLEVEGKALIRHFLHAQQNQLPWITLKWAQTSDDYMGVRGRNLSISNELSRRYVHQLRAAHMGILVGQQTALTDNPRLDVRYARGKTPVPIVLGTKENIPATHHVRLYEQTLFLNGDLKQILQTIADHGIQSVLVEGGAAVLQQFINSGYWQEAYIITAPQTLHTLAGAAVGIPAPPIRGELWQTITLEGDTIQVLNNTHALPTA